MKTLNQQKLRITKHTIRQLADVALANVNGGLIEEGGHRATGHCASGKASGCEKGCNAL